MNRTTYEGDRVAAAELRKTGRMGHVFSVELPFGFDAASFEVFDIEPDLDGVDWVEDDPALPEGSANLYVYQKSTVGVALHLDEEFEVWVPSLASEADWELVFGILQRSAALLDTVFVTWNDGDVWELSELVEHCDADWQRGQLADDIVTLSARVEVEGTVEVKGPMRSVRIGPWVIGQVADGLVSVEDVLLRTNYINGPHLVAQAATDEGRLVTVLGPGLRTLLPPSDAVLLDTIDTAVPPVLIPPDVLDHLEGIDATRLDEGHRLVQAVAEGSWPAILNAALAEALLQPETESAL